MTLLLSQVRLAPHFFAHMSRGEERKKRIDGRGDEGQKRKRSAEEDGNSSLLFSKEPLLKFATELCIMHPVTFLTGREPQLQCRR